MSCEAKRSFLTIPFQAKEILSFLGYQSQLESDFAWYVTFLWLSNCPGFLLFYSSRDLAVFCEQNVTAVTQSEIQSNGTFSQYLCQHLLRWAASIWQHIKTIAVPILVVSFAWWAQLGLSWSQESLQRHYQSRIWDMQPRILLPMGRLRIYEGQMMTVSHGNDIYQLSCPSAVAINMHNPQNTSCYPLGSLSPRFDRISNK